MLDICFVHFRHQRRLVNMLGKIEKSVVMESQENVPAASNNKPRSTNSKPRSSNNGPMKAVHRSINKVWNNLVFLIMLSADIDFSLFSIPLYKSK